MGRRILSTWNQIAPRAYQRQWFCFPHKHGNLELLRDHLRLGLDRLASYFPYLSGKLFLLSSPSGYLCIDSEDGGKIPLKIHDNRSSYPWTYARLKAQGFPARAFVDKSFDLPYQLSEDGDGIPVFEVHVRLIEGGLLLCIYCHHSASDGISVNNIVNSLAQLTRNPEQDFEVERGDVHVDLPEQVCSEVSQDSFNNLLSECPEYHLLSSPTGPTQFRVPLTGTQWQDIQKTGRIFVVGAQHIIHLQQILAEESNWTPSTFTCLAALTWAYVTKARLNSPRSLLSSSPDEPRAIPTDVRLMISIDWRRRAFADIMGSSAGNAVALPKMALSTDTILAACSPGKDTSCSALAEITRAIGTLISGVDDDFVAQRTALFRKAPDPRFIGLDADPRDPLDFYFNTWRPFGGTTRWKIPGVEEEDGGSTPDAIRRAQGEWNMGAGLILPARKYCSGYEVMVTLDVEAMEVLCEDAGWKSWVDEIFE